MGDCALVKELRKDEIEGRFSRADAEGADLGRPLVIPSPSEGRARVKSEAKLLDRDRLELAGWPSDGRNAGLPSYTGDEGEGGHELFLECLPEGELVAGGIEFEAFRLRKGRKLEKKERLLLTGGTSPSCLDEQMSEAAS